MRTDEILKETTVIGIGRRAINQMDRGFVNVSMSVHGAPLGNPDPLASLIARNDGERKPLEVSSVTDKAGTQEEELKKFSERDRAIVEKFNKLQGVIKVVDMGSGSGKFSAKYRERFPNHAIIGYEMNELTAGTMFDADWQVLGDAGQTGLLSESIDKVTINMPDPNEVETVIPHLGEEASRILKPGGEIDIVFEVSKQRNNPLIGSNVRIGERIILGALEELGFIVEHAGVLLGEVDPNYPRTGMMELFEKLHGGINLFKAKLPSTDEGNNPKLDSAQRATVLENDKDVGGIDLNPSMINLQTKGESGGFQNTFGPAFSTLGLLQNSRFLRSTQIEKRSCAS